MAVAHVRVSLQYTSLVKLADVDKQSSYKRVKGRSHTVDKHTCYT